VIGDIAHYAYDRFVEIRTGRAQGSDANELARAIDFGLRAVEADPANLEAHYYLGLSYEAAGKLQNAVDALLAGYDLNSASPWLNTNLVRVLIKGRQHEYASYLASRLYSMSHAEEWRTGLKTLMDDLADKDVDITKHPLLLPSWQRSAAP
jgi:Flp pilus assembly protein TadD